MAERRMFAKSIVLSDAFLSMPLTAQALYLHLNMNADDDGFVNSPKSIVKSVRGRKADLPLLEDNDFIIRFESGIVLIKHWKLHNLLRKDRYKETIHLREKAKVKLDFGEYNLKNDSEICEGEEAQFCKEPSAQIEQTDECEDECEWLTQYSREENRKEKNNIYKESGVECAASAQTFTHSEGDSNSKNDKTCGENKIPTLEEIRLYCEERGNYVDPEYFYEYYSARGWKIDGEIMANWRACINAWEKNNFNSGDRTRNRNTGFIEHTFDVDEFFNAAIKRSYENIGKCSEDKGAYSSRKK